MSFTCTNVLRILFVIKMCKNNNSYVCHLCLTNKTKFKHWIFLKNKDFFILAYYQNIAVAIVYDDLATWEYNIHRAQRQSQMQWEMHDDIERQGLNI